MPHELLEFSSCDVWLVFVFRIVAEATGRPEACRKVAASRGASQNSGCDGFNMGESERERERERVAILAQVLQPLLGGLCRLLASGGETGS